MSKKTGALFSKALFGYKKADVNEYIRVSDQSHDDQMVILKSECESLKKHVLETEEKIRGLEKALDHERLGAKEAIRKLSSEYEAKLHIAKKAEEDLKEKLQRSEETAKSNAERAESAEARAESAEEQMAFLTVELESARSVIEKLSEQLADIGEEAKKIAEFDEFVGRYALQHDAEKQSVKKSKGPAPKKPWLIRLVKRK